jgi:hypothetical protein
MIAGSYPIWILMDSHVVNYATFMCSVRYRCRSPECGDRGVEAIFFCWYGITLPKQAKNGEKKEILCPNAGK